MAYIRLSIVKPSRGQHDRAMDIMKRLAESASENEGCSASYLLHPHDESGEIARIAVYNDEQAADKSANSQRILSLRSELHLIIEPGHIERGFTTL
jgi:quinol monooxygenase YgiN